MHKILKIVAAILSLLGIVFLVRIIAKGDDEIEAAALAGDTAIIDPMAFVTYVILGLVLAFVLFFVIKNLFTNTAGLKNTIIGLVAFVAVLLIAYLVSGGDVTQYKNQDEFATPGQSQMVGAGLTAFYILLAVAAAAMIFSGVKKIISK
ncbi:hypothetical protein BTO05_10020 [Winogradskyella sp. PC-19]|uniref:hypothetical protein n=1 Tax=unclassified Winogradskyella TaxID=2615021 RepID=UPI000B3CC3C5|nr:MULTISPECIES: hypothetical protein [unclassified Winogradskyella]ARV09954.1 hypothetical protein BTO05_10020 [Winogradskyella sp. PC-19]RZN84373.1 MAG: hypothetical protein EVB12_00355 [Winogradskyella sp.]